MSTRQLAALRGQGTVFVHLTDTGLAHAAGGNPRPGGVDGPWQPPDLNKPEDSDRTDTTGGSSDPDDPGQPPDPGSPVRPDVPDPRLNTTPDLARVEGLGAPLRVADLADLLGHADIRLLPVHDLNTPRRADAYEHDNTTKDLRCLIPSGHGIQ